VLPWLPDLEHLAYGWAHSLSDVHTALTGAGLVVRALREYAYSPYGCFDHLEETQPDRWTVKGAEVAWGLVGGFGTITAFTLGAPISLSVATSAMGAGLIVKFRQLIDGFLSEEN
jgi:hypothetical protein